MGISNINRPGESSSLPTSDNTVSEQGPLAPQELFKEESFEKIQPNQLTLANGSVASISSSMGADNSAAIEGFIGGLSSEQSSALHSTATAIASEIQSTVAEDGDITSLISKMATQGNTSAEAILLNSTGIDEGEFRTATTSIMALGMGTIEEQLLGLAMGVKGSNEAKQDIRTTLTELREEIGAPDAQWPMEFTWTEYTVNSDNTLSTTEKTQALTKEEAVLLEDKLSSKLDTIGENASLLQFNLQNALQQQTEITNIFTSILKMMNEAMMNSIRNAKA